MIIRFLDGLTTPDEERQLRATLEAKTTLTADERAVLDLLCLSFPEEDTAALITEELSPLKVHHSPFFTRRLAVVSGIAAAVILAFILWPENHEIPIKPLEQQPVIAEMTSPEPVPMEKVEAEAPVLQTQTVPKRKAVAVVSKPQRIASKPRTPVPDDHQSIISTDDPQLVAAVEPAIREQIRTVHIAPGQVMYVLEVSNQPPSVEMPSVSELRARGVRLTADVQQHLQQASIQF